MWSASAEAEAMGLTRIRFHIKFLARSAELGDKDLSVEFIDRVLVTLNDQDRASDPGDLGPRDSLVFRSVVAFGIG